MALRDVFRGMMNGPRGKLRRRGGMPTITWAILGYLADKAFREKDDRPLPATDITARRL
ncbi:MAG TPA: hypothetical protein VEK34_11760 [Methylocella sp.]|nr:hypothetical protein [Methylocella sp.]